MSDFSFKCKMDVKYIHTHTYIHPLQGKRPTPVTPAPSKGLLIAVCSGACVGRTEYCLCCQCLSILHLKSFISLAYTTQSGNSFHLFTTRSPNECFRMFNLLRFFASFRLCPLVLSVCIRGSNLSWSTLFLPVMVLKVSIMSPLSRR